MAPPYFVNALIFDRIGIHEKNLKFSQRKGGDRIKLTFFFCRNHEQKINQSGYKEKGYRREK